MRPSGEADALLVRSAVGRHLESAPVAFAITEGPEHVVRYANAPFERLRADGRIAIGRSIDGAPDTADLTPLLDRVFATGLTVRDDALALRGSERSPLSCTVWPVLNARSLPGKLVIEVRDVTVTEGERARHRDISERLLLSALREQDAARDSANAAQRARLLATASRELAASLDEAATLDTVRRLVLARPGTWCIVDVIEPDGSVRRLPVDHPDPSKQALARLLQELWPLATGLEDGDRGPQPMTGVATHDFGSALALVGHEQENLRILREIGFGSALVAPLLVRSEVRGALTFVSAAGDAPFTAEEIALAMDLAARAAMAIDNARLYRSAEKLRALAELADRSKTEFLANMSHELRTPLNAISGFTDLISMEIYGAVTEEQRVALGRIKTNQEHLLALISDILDFACIGRGLAKYSGKPVALSQSLTDVAEALDEAIREKGHTVTRNYADTGIALADPRRVHQILTNLVMNAVKYTPAGGTITLSCTVVGDQVLAQVADTGPGVPPESWASIFEPFVQLSAGLTDRRGGVGLGLAISRDLARAMGGDLTVANAGDAGALFTLALPVAPAAPDRSGGPRLSPDQ